MKENGFLLGTGKIDFQKVRDAIYDTGYEGWLQIEGAVRKGGKIPEAYAANYRFLRRLFLE